MQERVTRSTAPRARSRFVRKRTESVPETDASVNDFRAFRGRLRVGRFGGLRGGGMLVERQRRRDLGRIRKTGRQLEAECVRELVHFRQISDLVQAEALEELA